MGGISTITRRERKRSIEVEKNCSWLDRNFIPIRRRIYGTSMSKLCNIATRRDTIFVSSVEKTRLRRFKKSLHPPPFFLSNPYSFICIIVSRYVRIRHVRDSYFLIGFESKTSVSVYTFDRTFRSNWNRFSFPRYKRVLSASLPIPRSKYESWSASIMDR